MPIGTHKANMHAHSSHIVLESQQLRCIRNQIEEDTSWAKAAAIAERVEKEANYLSVLSATAEIEDTIEKNEEQVHMHTTRPDLYPNCKQLRNMISMGSASCKE